MKQKQCLLLLSPKLVERKKEEIRAEINEIKSRKIIKRPPSLRTGF